MAMLDGQGWRYKVATVMLDNRFLIRKFVSPCLCEKGVALDRFLTVGI